MKGKFLTLTAPGCPETNHRPTTLSGHYRSLELYLCPNESTKKIIFHLENHLKIPKWKARGAVNLLNSSLAALTQGIKIRRLFMAEEGGERQILKWEGEGQREDRRPACIIPCAMHTWKETILIRNQVPQLLRGRTCTSNAVTQITQAECTFPPPNKGWLPWNSPSICLRELGCRAFL